MYSAWEKTGVQPCWGFPGQTLPGAVAVGRAVVLGSLASPAAHSKNTGELGTLLGCRQGHSTIG